jgi:hypothetical protein
VLNGWDVQPTLDRAIAPQASESFATGSSRPQALIQRLQRLIYELRLCKLANPVAVSTAACNARSGGGPAQLALKSRAVTSGSQYTGKRRLIRVLMVPGEYLSSRPR